MESEALEEVGVPGSDCVTAEVVFTVVKECEKSAS